MHSRTIKSICCIAAPAGLVSATNLHAQTLTLPFDLTQSSPALTFEIDSNGTLLESAPLNTSATFSMVTGPQMFWFAPLGAFRVGSFSSSSVGQYSAALGYHSTASGYSATALGNSTTASGGNSTALGVGSTASGAVSFAQGIYSTASGSASVALGDGSSATASYAVAFGTSTASGYRSTAMGVGTTASGSNSTAMGYGTSATAYLSTSTGYLTTANSYLSFTIGTYNAGLSENGSAPSSTTSWVATAGNADPLFEIGDGTSSVKSDAFVVFKDGDAVVQGTITAAAGGDIPMYTGD